MNEALFQIPVFLFSIITNLIPTTIGIVVILWLLRIVLRAGKKTTNTFRN
jgi:hypothetical protein